MSIYRGVSSCPSEIFAISIGNMLISFWVSVSLSQSKVYNIDIMLLFAHSNQKIVRLNISVQKVSKMNKLDSLKLRKLRIGSYHLISKHKDSFEREFPFTIVE